MAQLICHHLSVGYDSKAVLTDLNFEVNEQDYLCIVGENGAGKSTLMKTILGLQKPVEGRIMVGDGLAQNEIGYLPQQKASQKDFPASVREIVLSGCQGRCGLRPFYNTQEKKWQKMPWSECKSLIWQGDVIVSFQAVSSSACCLPEHFVQHRKCY